MSDQFDPYYAWLAIPPKDQPPNYYRLLGVELFESTAKVIQTAAEQRTVYLRTFQIGKHSAESQKLLGEVATAKICLLNTEKKAAYDQRLRQELQTSATQASGSKSAGLDSSVPGAAKPLERDSLSAAGPGLGKKPRPKPVVLIGGAVLAVVAIGSAALWWGLRGTSTPSGARLMEGEERPLAEPGINSPPESPQPAAENVPAVDVANSKEEPETQPAPSEPPKTESPKSEAKVTAESPQAATERPGTASTNQSKKSGGKKRRAVATKNPATVSANATNPPLSAHTSDMRTPVPSETAQAEAIQSPISSEGKEPSSKAHEPALAGYFQVVWVQVKTKKRVAEVWEFRPDHSVWETDRQIATSKAEGSHFVLSFTDRSPGTMTLRPARLRTFVGDQTRPGQGVWTCQLQPLSIVAIWEHWAGKDRHKQIQLWSNGHIGKPDSPFTWELKGSKLVLRWARSVDDCTLSPDGQSYSGKNQHRTPIHGKRIQ
ncbi:MAG: hypothetical protein ACLQNE_25480 [Thermoguttaceae bacterium]